MQNLIYLKNGFGKVYCTIRYDQSRDKVVVIWRGIVSLENTKEARNHILDFIHQNSCAFLLNDMQDLLSSSSEEFLEWIEAVWDEEAVKYGLRFIADVVRKDSLANVYINRLYQAQQLIPSEIESKLFYNLVDATSWLVEKQQENDYSKT